MGAATGHEAPARVSCTVADGVAQVRLTRPDKMNALDPAMFEALVATGTSLIGRDDVRAVVLSGEGRAFCAGLDLEQFALMAQGAGQTAAGERPTLPRREPLGAAEALAQQAVHVWSLVEAPVIAAVHGVALGGGLQLALGADLRIVAPDAKLALMEVQWGLVPDMMGTQLLPELVGRDRALELALTGRRVSGEEAVQLGLATRVADEPLAAATALAGEIAGHSGAATRGIKRLVGLAGRVDLAAGLAAEQEVIASLIGTDEQAAVVNRRLHDRG
ncbi:crotonase/enoyl-CoA hydratase family protein [Nocardioides pacificus]